MDISNRRENYLIGQSFDMNNSFSDIFFYWL